MHAGPESSYSLFLHVLPSPSASAERQVQKTQAPKPRSRPRGHEPARARLPTRGRDSIWSALSLVELLSRTGFPSALTLSGGQKKLPLLSIICCPLGFAPVRPSQCASRVMGALTLWVSWPCGPAMRLKEGWSMSRKIKGRERGNPLLPVAVARGAVF